MRIFCLIAVRNEEKYLPGFLAHIRPYVDGILAFDDGSADGTREILRNEPKVLRILSEEHPGPPHANETNNRYRLIIEAARLNAQWVICADADERFEEAFLLRIQAEAEKGNRTGEHVRCVQVVNLWNSASLYRTDGLCGPRFAPRMFKIPEKITKRPASMHRPWFPPELDLAPKANMDAYLYHLKMIKRQDREHRFQKFIFVDPNNEHQAIGYGHLICENKLALAPVVFERRYIDLSDHGALVPIFYKTSLTTATLTRPKQAEFDELYYLNHNLDVKEAITLGNFTSGWHHFKDQGASEGRQWREKAHLLGLDFETIINRWRKAKTCLILFSTPEE